MNASSPGQTVAFSQRAVAVLGGEPDEATLRRYLHGIPGVDAVGHEQRAASLGTRSIKTTSKAWALDKIIELIDLTTLEGADTPGKVRSLVAKALRPDAADPTTPRVAAVCVYGDMVPHAIAALGSAHGDPDQGLISVAAVATAFPSGRSSVDVKLADTAEAVAAGADEIDMVIDRGAFLAGNYAEVFNQIAQVKQACRRADGTYASLKVILETGEYPDLDRVRAASELAIAAGADFIKTSTGKTAHSASLPAARTMLEVIAATGRPVGLKPSGGIRNLNDAASYLALADEIMGPHWATPETFRFGASGLHQALADVIAGGASGQASGSY